MSLRIPLALPSAPAHACAASRRHDHSFFYKYLLGSLFAHNVLVCKVFGAMDGKEESTIPPAFLVGP